MKLYKDYKPLSFFGRISAVLFLVGLLLFIPVLLEYFKTGLVMRFPTLIVSMGIITSSLVMLACALILDTAKKYVNQFYEISLNILSEKEKNDER